MDDYICDEFLKKIERKARKKDQFLEEQFVPNSLKIPEHNIGRMIGIAKVFPDFGKAHYLLMEPVLISIL